MNNNLSKVLDAAGYIQLVKLLKANFQLKEDEPLLIVDTYKDLPATINTTKIAYVLESIKLTDPSTGDISIYTEGLYSFKDGQWSVRITRSGDAVKIVSQDTYDDLVANNKIEIGVFYFVYDSEIPVVKILPWVENTKYFLYDVVTFELNGVLGIYRCKVNEIESAVFDENLHWELISSGGTGTTTSDTVTSNELTASEIESATSLNQQIIVITDYTE